MSAPSEASSDEYDDDDDEEFTQTECLSLFEQCDSELFPEVRRRLLSPNITQHRKLKEIFSKKFGMTALHVSLYNRCPSDIVELIVHYAASDPRRRNLLAVKDDDYKNTPLHVAAQTGCSNDVLRFLVKTYPDALLSENDAKRTPLALIKRYFKSEFPAVPVLTKLTRSYTLYRTRLEVHLLLYRTFITEGTEVKAGCVKSRKKCDRALHMLGFFLVREQYGNLFHILSYVGGKWTKSNKTKPKTKTKSKKKRKAHEL
ncbi:hypothetical protein TrVE_jg3171 [Triparma verrucosa]|uniref:Uncharacterized protein n=1 Tax=Triparma verrucosa TaxID=1606542 RepID=A0A9W7EZ55_9STRA|nr:hypothetical protein TrVE_jg3171 [Triparma verrucosa]